MIQKLQFGRTGHESTRTLFGAAALGGVTQEEADQTLQVLLKYGVNHIDTAASYGNSELRIGPWMAERRSKFFLASKTGQRSYQQAHDEIRRSLEKLQVDQFDLIQLHNLVDPDEWNTAMGEDGALKAAIEARDEGLVRFIGVTGHGVTAPIMHQKSLQRFDFDSVLLPWNYAMSQNADYAREFGKLLDLCRSRQVAVQTIKSIAHRPYGDGPRTHATWYKPLEKQPDIDKAVHWLLGHPGIFLNTAGDIHVLPKVLDAASRFQQGISAAEMDAFAVQQALEPLFV